MTPVVTAAIMYMHRHVAVMEAFQEQILLNVYKP